MLDVGDWFEIYINQGYRPAEVLAIIGGEALIEYHMPAGTTALRIIDRNDQFGSEFQARSKIRNVSYFKLPRKWSNAMREVGSQWTGNPQQYNQIKGNVPNPY